MSKNFTLTINCDSQQTIDAMKEFFSLYQSNILPLIEASIQKTGTLCDPEILIQDNVISVNKITSNKGLVLDNKLNSVEYTKLSNMDRYIALKQGNIILYCFLEDDVDIQVGVFATLSAAAQNIDSKEIEDQIAARIATRSEMKVNKGGANNG